MLLNSGRRREVGFFAKYFPENYQHIGDNVAHRGSALQYALALRYEGWESY